MWAQTHLLSAKGCLLVYCLEFETSVTKAGRIASGLIMHCRSLAAAE